MIPYECQPLSSSLGLRGYSGILRVRGQKNVCKSSVSIVTGQPNPNCDLGYFFTFSGLHFPRWRWSRSSWPTGCDKWTLIAIRHLTI